MVEAVLMLWDAIYQNCDFGDSLSFWVVPGYAMEQPLMFWPYRWEIAPQIDEVICLRLPRQSVSGQGFKLVYEHLPFGTFFFPLAAPPVAEMQPFTQEKCLLYFPSVFEVVLSRIVLYTWWSFNRAEGHHFLLLDFILLLFCVFCPADTDKQVCL